jgi:hypothetical protein
MVFPCRLAGVHHPPKRGTGLRSLFRKTFDRLRKAAEDADDLAWLIIAQRWWVLFKNNFPQFVDTEWQSKHFDGFIDYC